MSCDGLIIRQYDFRIDLKCHKCVTDSFWWSFLTDSHLLQKMHFSFRIQRKCFFRERCSRERHEPGEGFLLSCGTGVIPSIHLLNGLLTPVCQIAPTKYVSWRKWCMHYNSTSSCGLQLPVNKDMPSDLFDVCSIKLKTNMLLIRRRRTNCNSLPMYSITIYGFLKHVLNFMSSFTFVQLSGTNFNIYTKRVLCICMMYLYRTNFNEKHDEILWTG